MSYSVNYVDYVRSTDYPSYCSSQFWFLTLARNVFTSIGKREKELAIQEQATLGERPQHVNNLQATSGIGITLDDAETRERAWRMFFGDEPLPQVRTDAVERYYGSLDKYVDWKAIDPKKLKGKIADFLDE